MQRKARPSAALNESSQAASEVTSPEEYGDLPVQKLYPDVPHKQALYNNIGEAVLMIPAECLGTPGR